MQNRKRILFIGIGGGCDIFGCLPLYYIEKETILTSKIILPNLTFTSLHTLKQASKKQNVKQVHKWVFLVHPISSSLQRPNNKMEEDKYFPEQRLANYLQHPIYTIVSYNKDTDSYQDDPTIKDLGEFFYETFFLRDQINYVYYVDGGCSAQNNVFLYIQFGFPVFC